MTQNIIPFAFKGHEIRTALVEGEPAFVGKDICDRLGYANPNKAMNDHCKGVTKRYPLQTSGGLQEFRVLFEPDVLRLIIKSKLPEAEEFERWVFEEVLPAIRKTGGYMAAAPEETPEELALRAMSVLQATVERQKKALDEAEPQIESYKRLANLEGLHNIRWSAQQCGWPERKFSDKLCELKWCYRHPVTGRLTVYRETINRRLMDTKNVEVKRSGGIEGVGQPMITQEGLAFLLSQLGPYQSHIRAEQMKKEIAERSAARRAKKATQPPFAATPAKTA